MEQTPRSERLHIVLYGRTNSGKSSLINALTGQMVSLVSDTPGTTTDPVSKAMELPGLGACVLIDTAGFDDTNESLGKLRIDRTRRTLQSADIAIVVLSSEELSPELEWITQLQEKNIPVIPVFNKADIHACPDALRTTLKEKTGLSPIIVSAHTGFGMDTLLETLRSTNTRTQSAETITGSLVSGGDTVLLVMPQDAQAPKGRLILPQVQTIRELLDKGCLPICCTPDTMKQALDALQHPPKLIITDSQAFKNVYEIKPAASLLTSFSILFAAYKGDIDSFVQGAQAIASLTPHSKVLIAEACTHAPVTEDIGRVKIPALLRKRISSSLQIEIVSGKDFPEDLTPYDLIIHCGACMFTRKMVMNRSERAQQQHVPMTNYGITMAYLTGILDKVALP
ncbi:[FeFe] hydrogenase H-cluster maturation GTPase HydF [Porphyromonas sp. COT-108 OH1349]|uniref:[FeFe] hydrogenase H-cluster maturation GTPase HydF n=1 Tax=Porphyromonas sp. COT-108 OH1349 TaxID=1537504 RepID=UPI00052D3B48|nr:[FeFe] hydrogenase H-cluster maturation GTPase HydF [Porphyromonas sp. COT-108 OH1349]KGN67485.1 GTP-binding protein [Porphyromonas sp. COT-108 OH1349]